MQKIFSGKSLLSPRNRRKAENISLSFDVIDHMYSSAKYAQHLKLEAFFGVGWIYTDFVFGLLTNYGVRRISIRGNTAIDATSE